MYYVVVEVNKHAKDLAAVTDNDALIRVNGVGTKVGRWLGILVRSYLVHVS